MPVFAKNDSKTNYITGDKNRGDVAIRMDLCSIPFVRNYFDLIICNHVLEHIDDDISAMREMHRVLADNGHAIITVPLDQSRNQTYEDKEITSPEDRAQIFGQCDHVRIYGSDFSDRLKSVGFCVKTTTAEDLVLPNECAKVGLGKASGDIYICRKDSRPASSGYVRRNDSNPEPRKQ